MIYEGSLVTEPHPSWNPTGGHAEHIWDHSRSGEVRGAAPNWVMSPDGEPKSALLSRHGHCALAAGAPAQSDDPPGAHVLDLVGGIAKLLFQNFGIVCSHVRPRPTHLSGRR